MQDDYERRKADWIFTMCVERAALNKSFEKKEISEEEYEKEVDRINSTLRRGFQGN